MKKQASTILNTKVKITPDYITSKFPNVIFNVDKFTSFSDFLRKTFTFMSFKLQLDTKSSDFEDFKDFYLSKITSVKEHINGSIKEIITELNKASDYSSIFNNDNFSLESISMLSNVHSDDISSMLDTINDLQNNLRAFLSNHPFYISYFKNKTDIAAKIFLYLFPVESFICLSRNSLTNTVSYLYFDSFDFNTYTCFFKEYTCKENSVKIKLKQIPFFKVSSAFINSQDSYFHKPDSLFLENVIINKDTNLELFIEYKNMVTKFI